MESTAKASEHVPDPASAFTESIADPERHLAHIWQAIAFRGLVAVAFGIVLIVWPSLGLATMVWIVGIAAIASGLVAAVATFTLPSHAYAHRRWLAVDAVVAIGIGVAVLVYPSISAKALLYLIALWAIATGVAQLAGAAALPVTGGRALLRAMSGVVYIAFGAVMFVEPGKGAVAEIALVAAYAIVGGVFDLALARELHELPRGLKRRTPEKPSVRAKPVAHG